MTALAFAVINLLAPFTWEGVFVPMVPDSARELFGAPVPFILGTTSPPRTEDLSPTAAVLFLQESVSFVTDATCEMWNNSVTARRAAQAGFAKRLTSVADAVSAAIVTTANQNQSKIKTKTKVEEYQSKTRTHWTSDIPNPAPIPAPISTPTPNPVSNTKHMTIEYTTWFTRLPDVSADMPFSEQLEREVATVSVLSLIVPTELEK